MLEKFVTASFSPSPIDGFLLDGDSRIFLQVPSLSLESFSEDSSWKMAGNRQESFKKGRHLQEFHGQYFCSLGEKSLADFTTLYWEYIT
ncbi:hypothetical protein WN48_00945 [Eufriesea mexicana]|nr:hypothetical protein WN48_00945 [Eufriesea mexicana]